MQISLAVNNNREPKWPCDVNNHCNFVWSECRSQNIKWATMQPPAFLPECPSPSVARVPRCPPSRGRGRSPLPPLRGRGGGPIGRVKTQPRRASLKLERKFYPEQIQLRMRGGCAAPEKTDRTDEPQTIDVKVPRRSRSCLPSTRGVHRGPRGSLILFDGTKSGCTPTKFYFLDGAKSR